jgi:hypothetical protein
VQPFVYANNTGNAAYFLNPKPTNQVLKLEAQGSFWDYLVQLPRRESEHLLLILLLIVACIS